MKSLKSKTLSFYVMRETHGIVHGVDSSLYMAQVIEVVQDFRNFLIWKSWKCVYAFGRRMNRGGQEIHLAVLRQFPRNGFR